MRFGVEMSTDHTPEEVGKQFDVTRERIDRLRLSLRLGTQAAVTS